MSEDIVRNAQAANARNELIRKSKVESAKGRAKRVKAEGGDALVVSPAFTGNVAIRGQLVRVDEADIIEDRVFIAELQAAGVPLTVLSGVLPEV